MNYLEIIANRLADFQYNETYAMMNVTATQARLFDAIACCCAFQEAEMLRLTDRHSLITYYSVRLRFAGRSPSEGGRLAQR